MTQEMDNKNLMLTVLGAFQDGDLKPLFAALSPEVVWKATAPKEFFRFGGIYHGIAGLHEYTALLSSRYHFTRFAPEIITANGDQVWGVFEVEALHQPSGRYVRFDISIRWTVKGGKIVEHQCFFDTAGVLMQQGELTVAAA